MPVDIFLKLDGITGEARDKKHGGEIDILSWTWALSAKTGRAGTAPVKSVEVDQLRVTKWVDRATPALMTALQRAQKIGSATMVCRKAGGSDPLEYLKFELKEVLVTAIRSTGVSSDERFTEEVALDFKEVTVSYQEQDDRGIAKGGAVEFTHALRTD